MFGFLRRLFGARDADADAALGGLWVAPLGESDAAGFVLADEGRYASRVESGALVLELRKPSLFAWTEAPARLCDDFAIEARIRFLEAPGHAAAGLILRGSGERDFVYVLVSNRGHIRMDAVFNGEPRTVVPWTELPSAPSESFELLLSARGSVWTAFVDGAWAFEAEDDTAEAGWIAFAAQHYGDATRSRLALERLVLETRPGEVEVAHYGWLNAMPPESGQRLALVRSFHAAGAWLAGAVQLKRAERQAPLDADGQFLRAEGAIRMELWDEAEAALSACLALDPAREDAREERANLLYLRSRYLELRDYLEAERERCAASPRLSNLLGHAFYNLGDWTAAAEAYARAAELEPGMPIFLANEARARADSGDAEGAWKAWLAAAKGFLAAEARDDLASCLERLAELRPRSPELAALRAKLLFMEGHIEEADKALERLVKAGSEDSAIWYLSGLIRSQRGEREAALPLLERACELEPSFPLYWFRLAEARFLSGKDPKAALETALALDPEDGWIRNLEGQVEAASGGLERAEAAFRTAIRALDASPDPALNLAALLLDQGRPEEVEPLLSAWQDDARARNLAGNALAAMGKLEAADAEYARAIALASGGAAAREVEYRNNRAACLVELERWADAEEVLRPALEAAPDARAYALAGRIAWALGDTVRSEAAFLAALDLEPDDARLVEALARNYLSRRKDDKVRTAIERLRALDGGRAELVEADFLEASTEKITCSGCERLWRVPRPVPRTSAKTLRIVPPDDVPAGACPSCGRIWCVACRKDAVGDDGRLSCGVCGQALKLNDERLRYLVHEGIKRSS